MQQRGGPTGRCSPPCEGSSDRLLGVLHGAVGGPLCHVYGQSPSEAPAAELQLAGLPTPRHSGQLHRGKH